MITLSPILILSISMMVTTPGQPNQRVWLNGSLEVCEKKQAMFYLEPNGMDGDTYVARMYCRDGRLKADGHYADAALTIEHGQFVFYHADGTVESRGMYEMGHKSGIWQRFDEHGKELAEKVYDPEPLKDILYTRAETMPQFPGGQKEFVSYLKQKTVGEDGVNTHGTATASFVVERDGNISEVKVIDGTGSMDERLVNAVRNSPPWTPGKEDGLPVRVRVQVPVPY